MTCIVAIADGENVVIGGDSAGVDGRGRLQLRADAKVFQKGNYVIGFTTSFRMGQILRYETELPEPPAGLEGDELERFFVTELVPAVRASFAEHGFGKTARLSLPDLPGISEEGQAFGGTFVVGVEGRIFEIGADFQLGRPAAPYTAVGLGAPIALGTLHGLETVEALSLSERVTRALEAAETYSSVVRRPFRLVELAASKVRPQ